MKENCHNSNSLSSYYEIWYDIINLLDLKNKAYNNSYDQTRRQFGRLAFLIRLYDKVSRLQFLINNSDFEDKLKESYEDTIKDIIGYCFLELNYLRQNKENNNKNQ